MGAGDEAHESQHASAVEVAREAVAPVLRDVAATTDVRLTVDCGEGPDWDGPWVRVTTPDGGSHTFAIDLAETPDQRVETAATKVQDVVIDEQRRRASNWPMCPDHRSSHPLEVAVTPDGAWWTCPAQGRAVARVGTLRLTG